MTSKSRGVTTLTCDLPVCKCDERFIGKAADAKLKATSNGWIITEYKGRLEHYCCDVHYKMRKFIRAEGE